MFLAMYWRKNVEIQEKQGEMKDWASGNSSLFFLREGKCGGEGHKD